MKPEIHLPRVNSGKISLGKTMFPRAKVRSVLRGVKPENVGTAVLKT